MVQSGPGMSAAIPGVFVFGMSPMKRILLGVVVIVAAVIVFFLANAWSGGIDGLGGEPWTLVGLKENGKEVRKEGFKGIKLQFTKSNAIWYIPTEKGLKPVQLEYRIDPNKKPKSIILEQIFTDDEPQPLPGIYEIENDVLLIALG